jgi:uncharacterized protein (DUF885 family)
MFTTRRAFVGSTAVGLALAGCATPSTETAASGSTSDFNALLDRISTEILREAPEYSTMLAVSEERAGGRYIDRLSDVSKAGKARSIAQTERMIAEMRAFNRDTLSAADKVSYDVVLTAADANLAAARFSPGGGATGPYAVTQLTGSYTGTPDFLASHHPVTNREQADAYLTRLSLYARQLDQENAVITEDAGAGTIPPDFAIRGAVSQLQTFARIAPGENPLVSAFAQKLQAAEAIPAADRTALAERAQSILTGEVLPAYQRQIDTLNGVLPRATSDAGIWKLPQGAEMYAAALRVHTTTSMGPDEIHNLGVDLLRQLQSEMETIFRAQGMTRGTLLQRYEELGRRPDQIYPSTDEGRAQLLAALNDQVRAITVRMPEVCHTQARVPLEIKRVPAYTEAGAPGGYYQPAALDGSRPGSYYINLRDPANEWQKYKLPTLTYHEGVPGHHWQISVSQEAQGLPFIRSALLGFGAYQEGWGLYSEQLADEMGMYANDPFGRLGYLQSMAFRASRLVCDTGLHDKRWTREQAIRSMVEATGNEESSTTTEIERYCVWPGQATGYMVGRQAINNIRQNARNALGARFDIRGFHDAVLTNGATPLSVTESLVNEWVATQRA